MSLFRRTSVTKSSPPTTAATTSAPAKQAEQELELVQLKEKLAKAEKELEEWSAAVKKAILEGDEKSEAKAKEERAIYLGRVEALEKQITALQAALAPPRLKILQKSDFSGEKDSITEFFAREIASPLKRMRLDNQELREKAVREFSSNLFMDKGLPQVVLIRDCYRVEADKIHRWMGTKPDPAKVEDRTYSVFIGGTRGVGKSIFGTLMVFEFVDLGYAVLYEHKMQRMLMIGKNLMPEQKRALETGFNRFGYDTSILSEPGVYRFVAEDASLFEDLILYNRPIHVQDLGEGSIAKDLTTTGQTRRLILSSPRDSSLRQLPKLQNNENVRTLIMPLWTLEELQNARGLCYSALPEATVVKRYEMYGGVARHVLQYSDDVSQEEFFRQLGDLKPADLLTLLKHTSYADLPSFRDVGFFIHVKPKDNVKKEDANEKFTCVYASEYAFKEVIRVCLRQQSFEAFQFAQLLKEHPEAATFYGRCIEETAHHLLAREGSFELHDIDLDVMIDPLVGPAIRTVAWPQVMTTVFFNDISELKNKIATGVYYRPNSKTYETIDAFTLMDGSLLDGSKFQRGQTILVLIQVTVSSKHRVNGAKVKEVHQHAYEKWEGKTDGADFETALPRVLVFATRKYPEGVHSYQKLTKADKKQYKAGHAPKLVQYALTLERDFEAVSKVLASSIPVSAEEEEE